MEFGRVGDVDAVNFILPPDPPDNSSILSGKTGNTNIYVGCAKWGRQDWIGKVYPQGTRQVDFLVEYAKRFNTIELNATHYRIFSEKIVEGWRDKVGPNFTFCPKFFQNISHYGRLKNVEDLTDQFFKTYDLLGDKLGPYFLQLHHSFGPKDIDVIDNYLSSLPIDVRVFLEVRHPDWFNNIHAQNELFACLKAHNKGAVITDTAGRRDVCHMRHATPSAFIRFVGNSLHQSDYARCDHWVKRILQWVEHGIEDVWFFMHQHEELYSPELCAYFIKQLNKQGNLDIPEPQFIEEAELF